MANGIDLHFLIENYHHRELSIQSLKCFLLNVLKESCALLLEYVFELGSAQRTGH